MLYKSKFVFGGSKKKNQLLLKIMFVLLVMIWIIGIILSFYSYLVRIEASDGTSFNLAMSLYNFESKFFQKSSYNLIKFPQIISLLNSLKTGIILVLLSSVIIFNTLLSKWLINRGKLLNIFKN